MMTNKLTGAQIAILRTGFQRADHCIVAPTGKGVGAKKSAAKMIEAGWLKEIKAKPGAPIWRTDDATGTAYSLKLTTTGLKVIAVNDMHVSEANPTPCAPCGDEGDGATKSPAPKAEPQEEPSTQPNFREGSKIAEAMKLLRREGGVTIDELSAAMNWLPHSTRAVLTGLRKRGVLVERRKMPDKRASAYFVEMNDTRANGQR